MQGRRHAFKPQERGTGVADVSYFIHIGCSLNNEMHTSSNAARTTNHHASAGVLCAQQHAAVSNAASARETSVCSLRTQVRANVTSMSLEVAKGPPNPGIVSTTYTSAVTARPPAESRHRKTQGVSKVPAPDPATMRTPLRSSGDGAMGKRAEREPTTYTPSVATTPRVRSPRHRPQSTRVAPASDTLAEPAERGHRNSDLVSNRSQSPETSDRADPITEALDALRRSALIGQRPQREKSNLSYGG